MNNQERHTITDGPYTEDIEVEWTGDESVSLTQLTGSEEKFPLSSTVHVSMDQLHALGIEATKRLALRHLPPDAVPLPIEDNDEDVVIYGRWA